MRKRVCALVILLLLGLFIASVECQRVGNYVIRPSDEAIEKIRLAPPESVFGNVSVSNGFVDFYITSPSYEIVYQSLKTSAEMFNFAANESGTYVMHFANKYQTEDVNVTLSYACNFYVVLSETIHVSVSSTQTVTGTVTITRTQPPYLILDVSPLAFPVVGQFWKLSVYYQVKSSDGIAYYSPLPNATVEITVRVGNQTKVYCITSDEMGQIEFQFLAEYSDISFQAVSGENRSDIFALTQRSEHYVRADFVELILRLSLFMSGITAVSEGIMLHYRKRIRVIFNLLIGAILCFSLVQLIISVYAQMNLWTPWGYPASIFDLIRWDFLGYASLVGLVIFAILNVLAYLFKPKSSEVVVPLK
jgi:hypothetical protein